MARKGRRSSQQERILAIELVEQGYTKREIASILQVTEASVYGWQKAYQQGGISALSTKIASGRKRSLSDAELLKLAEMLRETPRSLGYDFGLWTRKRVRELIHRELGIEYTEQNVGKLLRRFGLAPEPSSRNITAHSKDSRKEWVEAAFPGIAKRAADERGSIFLADEMRCEDRPGASAGEVPATVTTGPHYAAKHENSGMILAISMRGKMRWITFRGSMTSAKFTLFLKELMLDVKGKIFLIADKVKYHTAAEVGTLIEANQHRIEILYLDDQKAAPNIDEQVEEKR